MGTTAYLRSIFTIIERIINSEMTDQGRGVVENYLGTAAAEKYGEKARYAIFRYTEIELPTLEDIRKKSKTETLSRMDHLILKMEYESRQLDREGG